jgi:DNA-binding Lrp family transcriptional regulator
LLLFGEYDVYARLECESFGILGGVVINRIRSIEGVDSTKTLTAAPVH